MFSNIKKWRWFLILYLASVVTYGVVLILLHYLNELLIHFNYS